jgi:uncharacterized protein (TIGR02996 family)
MSDDEALLAAILAHPDEDTPRLMYADWLQENGQPERAEFIRLQLVNEFELTRDQCQRYDQLEEKYRDAWTAHLPRDSRDTYDPWEWKFARGMPEVLWCDADGFVTHHRELTTGTHIRDLFLNDAVGGWLTDVARVGWPSSVASLALQECPRTPLFIYGYDCTDGIVAVASAPQLRSLRELRLGLYGLSDRAVRALVSSPHLDNLVQFLVEHCWLAPESVELLRSHFGSRLQYTAPAR